MRARSSMHFTVWERGKGAFSESRMAGFRDSRPEVQIVEGLKRGVLSEVEC